MTTMRYKLRFRPPVLTIVACEFIIAAYRGQAQSQQQQSIPDRRPTFRLPIAVSTLPSGLVSILQDSGELLLLDPNKGVSVPIKSTLGFVTPIDLDSARLGDREVIVVSTYWQGQAIVVEYSLQGNEIGSWRAFGHLFAGVTIDDTHKLIYLVDSRSGEIATIDTTSKSPPKTIARVRGALRLAAATLDEQGQRLFVSDAEDGKLYAVDLKTRTAHVVASGIGEPAALAYDSRRHKVYIADASRNCIWQVPVDTRKASKSVFSSISELQEPRGVAVGPDGSVWVANFQSGTILKLAQNGRLERTFR